MFYQLSPLGDQAILIQLGEDINMANHKKIQIIASYLDDQVDLVSGDDEAAKGRVKQMVDRHWIELWHEGRRVATFEPKK